MHIHIVSIFPEIFDSFLSTSLIKKAQERGILTFHLVNPRQFCPDRHQKVDDTIYGGGAGLLMKALPAIQAVESIVASFGKGGVPTGTEDLRNKKKSKIQSSSEAQSREGGATFKIILPSPSKDIFTQKQAHALSSPDHLIFVCTRYEGIDYRFEQYMKKTYKKDFIKLSLGQFITLGGETPAMVMMEAITRLIPGVIKEEVSWQEESYSLEHNMSNLEYPQYTHPEEVLGMKVPKILLSGHHANIQKRRESKTKTIKQRK